MQTVLLVEDDEHERILYERELSEEGYRVIVAQNGREAVEKVQQGRPDVVVLDINMPQMDGLEAMGRILELFPKTPVIINTAYSSYKESFLSWAADAYVIKSSNLDELKGRVREALQKTQPQGE
jgi:DNA-binding response OmpR family regulator